MKDSERPPERPTGFVWFKRLCYAGVAVVALAEIVLPLVFPGDHAPHFRFESFPAWGLFYGLASCVAIILVSKFLGKAWLMRGEDYYES